MGADYMPSSIRKPLSAYERRTGVIVAIIASTLSIALVLLLAFDLARAWADPTDYPFGAENLGWRYRTPENYRISGAIELMVAVALVVAAFLVRSNSLKMVFGFAPIPFLFLVNNIVFGVD